MNNKGDLPISTIGEWILVIAAIVIIAYAFLAIVGFISPATASVGCGLNVRIDAAMLENSKIAGKSLVGAPIVMCNQYRTPVDINAANFNSCRGIADFCKKAKQRSNATKRSHTQRYGATRGKIRKGWERRARCYRADC